MIKKIGLYIQYYVALLMLGVVAIFVWVDDTSWYFTNNTPAWAKPKGQFFREGKQYLDMQMGYYQKKEKV